MIKGLIILLLVTQFSTPAAVKIDQFATKQAIVGLWRGTFTVSDGSTGTFYFSIKPNNQLLIENYHKGVQRIANGTWKLRGKKFTCKGEYFYGHPSNIGTVTGHLAFFNGDDELNSGTWKNISPNNDSGSFSLKKIK